jgi:hypothetical protein
LGKYDTNKLVEGFFGDLLNIVFGWELVKKDKITFPAIDLGCDKFKIGVQVTSQNSYKKINDTLLKFDKYCLADYNRLVVFIITKKSNHSKKFKSIVKFDKDTDILDVDDLLFFIEHEDILKIKSIAEYVQAEIPYYIGKIIGTEDLLRHRVDYSNILPRNFKRFTQYFTGLDSEFEEFKQWCNEIHEKLLSLSKKQRYGVLVFLTKCDKGNMEMQIQTWGDVLESSFGLNTSEIRATLKIIEDKGLLYNGEGEIPCLHAFDDHWWQSLIDVISEKSELQELIVDLNFSILDR